MSPGGRRQRAPPGLPESRRCLQAARVRGTRRRAYAFLGACGEMSGVNSGLGTYIIPEGGGIRVHSKGERDLRHALVSLLQLLEQRAQHGDVRVGEVESFHRVSPVGTTLELAMTVRESVTRSHQMVNKMPMRTRISLTKWIHISSYFTNSFF